MRIITQFEKESLLFQDPIRVITCSDPLALPECFVAMEEVVAQGHYLAGFISYEAGYSFETRLNENKAYDFPLLCFGVYESPQPLKTWRFSPAKTAPLTDLRLNISREEYFSKIETIRRYISQGDVYQVTYCLKMLFGFQGDAFGLYHNLLRAQPVPYPAFIETKDFHVLSLSPEMFIHKTKDRVRVKPMKGTWPAVGSKVRDFVGRWQFQFDAKNRAENVMIADLLRNDLGRVGARIRAPRLFEVARYRTLFQMTSTVTARIDPAIPLQTLFSAIFPSGSVTGAPKIRAMQIIRELEPEDRRIYTGAIGFITPQKDLFFNVPIRTLLIRNGQGEMGIGGGIVWDSTPQGEWEEGLIKAAFLGKPRF